MTDKAPRVMAPGEPLRLFVRGFLRDHLGFSKILADHAADVFMERWANRKEYADRYAVEDIHTLAAKFDRDRTAVTSKLTGLSKKDKATAQDTLNRQEQLPQPLQYVVPRVELRFPNPHYPIFGDGGAGDGGAGARPNFDPTSRIYSAGR